MGVGSLRARRQGVIDDRTLSAQDLPAVLADVTDQWIKEVATAAAGGNPQGLALLAVGGYGRSELCPGSDLDLVLVHQNHREIASVADAIWYPIWDEGLHLDHSVRTPKEMRSAAQEDLRVALGLVDARCVFGDINLARNVIEAAATQWRVEGGEHFLDLLGAQIRERKDTHGDVAFLLEPDLKEAHGGLRDVAVLQAWRRWREGIEEIVDFSALRNAAQTLLNARVELQRASGRSDDQLVLQDQDQVAEMLGFISAGAFMADLSSAGRAIAWSVDDAWRRRSIWAGPASHVRVGFRRKKEAHTPIQCEHIEDNIVLLNGEIALDDLADPRDPAIALLVAAVSGERQIPIERSTLVELGTKMATPPPPWSRATRENLVRLLCAGPGAIDAFEALDHEGLIVRLLPEWAFVRNRPQRNAYHRFTVDRHLLEAAVNASEHVTDVARADLLLIGTFLHDIGKGFPGDHTEVGVVKVAEIAKRMGFDEGDVEILVALCRCHLLLADTATRRDLDDPATIAKVADEVGDPTTLHLLHALTQADSLATGPAAWGTWKKGLVGDLVERVGRHLAGLAPVERSGEVIALHREIVERVRQSGSLAVVISPPTIVVAAPDRRGLLASVTGVLALLGVNVQSADVAGSDGVAIEIFTVEPAHGRWPQESQLARDLERAIEGELDVESGLKERAAAYGRKRSTRATPIHPRVVFDNAASQSATVIELRAHDDVGLLHQITRVLYGATLDVVSSRVSTFGAEVIDAFYVRNSAGEKIVDPDVIRSVEDALLAVIS
jgi:[protein-PII] uridylyltransferase